MYIRTILIFSFILAFGPRAWAQVPPVAGQAAASKAAGQAAKPDEITLELNVVQIILNDEHRGGVDWGAIVSDFHTVPLKKENDPVWNDQKHRLSFGTVSEDDYTVLLDALDMAGEMSQFPHDPVKVIAGTPVSISFPKQDIHVEIALTRLKSGDLSLRVEPKIAVVATEIWNGEKIPASVTLVAGTDTAITNDMTIIIGGLMKEEEISRKHKFPLLGQIPSLGDLPMLGNFPMLGKIPIVGLVFRHNGRLMKKTEIVIFLTVRAKAVEVPEEDSST